MTFEKWWELHGKAIVYELQSRPADSFAAIEQTLRTATFTGWHAAESNARNKQTAFEAWWEMHNAECQEGRYNIKKCFELCWNAALDAVDKEVPIPVNIAKSDAELLIRGLESLRVTL